MLQCCKIDIIRLISVIISGFYYWVASKWYVHDIDNITHLISSYIFLSFFAD